MRLIIILFFVFCSTLGLGQNKYESHDCDQAHIMSQVVFMDFGTGWSYYDLKKYFLPEEIKKEKVTEFKYSITYEELKWKQEELKQNECASLIFKFDEEGFVNEIHLEHSLKYGQFHSLQYENGFLVYGQKDTKRYYIENEKKVLKREVTGRIKHYYNERNLLTKIEHLSVDDTTDIAEMSFLYEYDEKDRLIRYEWAGTNSNVWKTEYFEGTNQARDSLFINGFAEGIVNKTFDESQNLIYHASISDYGKSEINYKYNESNQLIQYNIKDKNLDSSWDYEYDNNGFLKGITMYFDKFRVLIQRI